MTAFLVLLLFFVTASTAVGQVDGASKAAAKDPILVDEFGLLPECDFRGRLDLFLAELSQKAEHRGYIINYMSDIRGHSFLIK